MKLHALRADIFVLADYATISQEGKLSINGIFDELRVAEFPGGIARAFLVAVIEGTPDKSYELKIDLQRDAEKTPLNSMTVETVTGANGKSNLVFEIPGLSFEREGTYKFVMSTGKEQIGTTTVQAITMTQKKVNYRLPN